MHPLHDQFQTPPFAGKFMASLVPEEAKRILEPTPGNGQLADQLKNYDVTAPADFFLLDKNLRFDCVVMNPPFSPKYADLSNAPAHYHSKKGMRTGYEILKDCMLLSDNIIALMPWFTLIDSDVRLKSIKNFGIKSITAMPRKTFPNARVQCVVMQLVKNWHYPTNFYVYDLL